MQTLFHINVFSEELSKKTAEGFVFGGEVSAKPKQWVVSSSGQQRTNSLAVQIDDIVQM